MTNDPTGRVLQLLSLLQTHRHWRGDELATRMEVTVRTVRRDIERLRLLGYPVEATPGVDGGYRLAAGSHMPPLVLDDDEAVAIAVGLVSAAGSGIADIDETSARALAKLEQLLPDALRRRIRAVTTAQTALRWQSGDEPSVEIDTLSTLAQACRDLEEVRFGYRRKDGVESDRLVQPHRLVTVGRRWYLAAWDCRRRDWRTFRLDRIDRVTLAGARFEAKPIPGGDANAYVEESLGGGTASVTATVTVRTGAVRLASDLPWLAAQVTPIDDESCRLRLRSGDETYLLRGILRLADDYDLVIDEMPDAVRERLGRLQRRLATITV